MKKTICLDFDGVIHSYCSPWVSQTHIPDPPVPGAFDFITKCLDHGYAVAVFSVRSSTPAGQAAIQQWFRDHEFDGVHSLDLPQVKPRATLYIDDFEGVFPSMEFIESFKPWNR